jgi:DNA-directed RNA polymerase subunit RPC12/RpoP
METVGQPVVRVLNLKFRCPSCGRKFATKPELAGQKIRCNRCGKGVRVPHGDGIFTAKSSRSAESSVEDSDDAPPEPRTRPKHSIQPEVRPRSDEIVAKPFTRPAAASRRSDIRSRADEVRARADHGAAKDDDIITSVDDEADDAAPLEVDFTKIRESKRRRRTETVLPSRGELMEQVRQQTAEQDVSDAKQKKVEKAQKKKKKKKHSSFFDPKETLKLVAGVAAVVGVLAFLAWGYPEFRFPLGGLLCVIGFIVYLLGSVSIRQLVAEEGVLKALVFRFCPPYQWWFVATHWEETKDFVAFFVAGLIIMAVGSGVIKTSATGKKAEESERAYQKAMRGRQNAVPPVVSKGIVGEDD